MVNYSVIIYAQEMIGSDLLSGIGFGLAFGPPIVLGWYAGVLCDRLAPGRLIQMAQAVFMLAIVLLWAADAALVSPAAARGAAGARGAVRRRRLVVRLRRAWPRSGQIARARRRDQPASVIFNLLVMLGFGLGPPFAIALARAAARDGTACSARRSACSRSRR